MQSARRARRFALVALLMPLIATVAGADENPGDCLGIGFEVTHPVLKLIAVLRVHQEVMQTDGQTVDQEKMKVSRAIVSPQRRPPAARGNIV